MVTFWRRISLLVMLVGLSAPVGAQAPETDATVDSSTARGRAYRWFLNGRHLEGEGDIDGAIAAYREASELDTDSGEALAELASLHARRNEAAEAVDAAEEALSRESDNLTAHRILGLVLASQAGSGNASGDQLAQAITHLEAAGGTILPDLQVELTLGRLYLASGQVERAVAHLESLLEDESGLSDAGVLLSEAYEDLGRLEEALAAIEGVVANGRASSRALRRLGELYGRNNRWGDAVEAYERAVERNPRSRRSQRDLADALLRAGETDRGRDLLRQLTTNSPDDGTALYRLSEVELQLGNLDEAADAAERLIAAEPNGIRGPYALAEVYSRRHNYRSVVETLEPAVRAARQGNLRPNQIASLLGRVGFAYERLQDYPAAARAYEEASDLLPTSLAFGARLVQAYLELGRVADAREALDRVENHHAGSLTVAGLEARLLAGTGHVEVGASVLREALGGELAGPQAYVTLAGFYSEHDQLDQASELLESAASRFPEELAIWFQLGAVMEQRSRFDEAERAFRQVLDENPQHADTLNYLGYMLADRGVKLEESVDLLERAIGIDPHNGAYLDSLGWAYFKLERLDLAETHLRHASEQMERNSVIQDHLGDLLFKLGRYQEALSVWETALAGDGEGVALSDIEEKMGDARQRLDR
jgi:tetratricopeptide (TPR) repeat protein